MARLAPLFLLVLALVPLVPAQAQRAIRGQVESQRRAPAPAQKPPSSQPPDDEPANALPPVNPRAGAATEADVAVLRAIGFLFEPAPREIRVLAVGDVALLGDPRGLDPLAHMILDPDPVVAEAAALAVGRFKHPRAEQILANVAHHPSLSVALKLAALRGLPLQDTASSRELLTELSTSDRQAPPVRELATELLKLMATGSARGLSMESQK